MLRFEFDKATKSTFRFKEVVPEGSEELVGSLYVKKTAFKSQPKSLVVSLSAIDKDGAEVEITT